MQNCQWLQKLMCLGLLRAAWRPSAEVCVLRAVARQRGTVITEQATRVQRMQKALLQMNIQFTDAVTNVMGQTGQAIIRDIVAGQRDPTVLALQRHLQGAEGQLARVAPVRAEAALAMCDGIDGHLAEHDALHRLTNWAGVDLTRINGLDTSAGSAAKSRCPSEASQPRGAYFMARLHGRAVAVGSHRPLDSMSSVVPRRYRGASARRLGAARAVLITVEHPARVCFANGLASSNA